jgi:hypothetical protein
MTEIKLLIAFSGVALFVLIIELIRRKHLREKYALVWVAVAVGMFFVSIIPGFLEYASHVLKVYYPPSLAFIIAILFLLLINLMLSIVVSHQTNRVVKLTQELGLLENRVENIEKSKVLSGNQKDS